MKNKLSLTGCIVLFVFATWVGAESLNRDIESWLEKMHHAAHMANYQGVFVYDENNNLSSMRIFHGVNSKGERERLVSLDNGREVIRTNSKVICILPDSNSVVVDKSRPVTSFPPVFPIKIDQLSSYYNFSLDGRGKVAGRMAQKISILPKDEYRYGHQLWIDEKTGLLLKTNLLDSNNKSIEVFMFTQIEYMKEVPDKLLRSSIEGKNFTWYESDDEQKPHNTQHKPKILSKFIVAKLPAGFKEVMSREHKMPRSGMPVEHYVFTDGLTSVSVFVEQQGEKNEYLLGGSRMGAINAHGKVMNGYHVTVVGEVPQQAVRLICNSIRYKDE